MPRKKVTKKAATKRPGRKRVSTRLRPSEQVGDREKAIGFGSSVKNVYVPRNRRSVSEIRELILSTIWAETCIETIVDEVVKHKLYTDPMDEEIQAFLDFPSLKEPLFIIRKKYLKDMLRWGNGAAVVEYSGSKPTTLSAAPGYTLRVTDDEPSKYRFAKMDSNGRVSNEAFKEDSNGNVLEFEGKEIMHFQIDADSDTTLARSAMDRAYDDMSSDKESQQKLVEHLRRGFYKPSFISFKKGVSVNKKELEEFVEYLNGLIEEGAKMLGINKDMDFHEIPYWSAKEIIEMQQWLGLKIASAFKVPPFMVNLVNDVGSLNAREQKQRFLENVITPILEYEAFMFSSVIARQGFNKPEIEIRSNVLGTQMNWNRARIAKLLTSPNQKILTTDELRKIFFNLPASEVLNSESGEDLT